METLKKLRLSMWKKLLHNYYAYRTTISNELSAFTFPPSREFIGYLSKTFTESTIALFENGPTFSAYEVSYDAGGTRGRAIYKTTVGTYPSFCAFKTVEEYQNSFAKGERPTEPHK
ncbi:MAG: hypothetical protein V4649_06445 [Bacteroidota bacterium]